MQIRGCKDANVKLTMELRKCEFLFDVTVGEDELIFKKVGPIDLTKGVKIPTYKWCYESYFTILSDLPKYLNGRKNDALNRVAKELTEVYLYADLCPTSENTMRERLQKG